MANVKSLLKDIDFKNNIEPIEIEVETIDNSAVAIIGISGRFSMAKDIREFWSNLEKGVDCIRSLPENRIKDYYKNNEFDEVHYKNNKKAYLDDIDKFDYNYFSITPNEASLMDPNQRLLLENTIQAIEDSGYGGKRLDGANVGVFVGFSNDLTQEYKFHCMEHSTESLNKAVAGNLKSVISSRISYFLNLKGPSVLIDTACSSALVAVHMACQSIKNKECDMAIVGGVELDIFKGPNCNIDLGINSSDGKTKTFDDSSDGTGAGEGVISIILKPLAKALNDRDNIYAVIKGSAINQDGATIGITAPNPIAQAEVIEKAWKNGKINPETVSYIETHGTGTILGDPIEISGIQTAFQKYTKKKQFCAVGSVKSNIGHLSGAAGIAGLVKMALSLKNKKIPPSIHFKSPNKKIPFIKSPVYVNNKLLDWQPIDNLRRGAVSSFGLSGTNCHVVLEEAPNIIKEKRKNNFEQRIFSLSAIELDLLYALVEEYIHFFESEINLDFNDVCYTANTGRGHYGYRLAIIADNIVDLKNKLRIFLNNDVKDFEKNNILYKCHKIISNEKLDKDKNEIYEFEKVEISKHVDYIINEIAKKDGADKLILMRKLCQSYTAGAEISWLNLYRNGLYYRCSLPHYQYKKERCWIESKKTKKSYNVSEDIEDLNTKCSRENVVNGERFNLEKDSFQEIVEIVVELVSKSTGIKSSRIDIFMNFFEMGLDSILLLDLIHKIQSRFNIEISASKFYGELTTINSLSVYIMNNCYNVEMSKLQYGDTKHNIGSVNVQDYGSEVEANFTSKDSNDKKNTESSRKGMVNSKAVMPFGQISLVNDNNIGQLKKDKLNKFIHDYNLRTEKSKRYASENRLVLANNRNTAGFRPNMKELVYPIVSKGAYGSKMIDLDDNEYIDLTMGFGVYMFGNNPGFIKEELINILKDDMNIGPMSNLAYEAAKLISQLTGVERVAFSNTGTEANMMAVRLARASTKRKKIVVFEGSYHGNYDGVLVRSNLDNNEFRGMPIAPGITNGSVEDTIPLEYGSERSLEYIQSHAQDIAAVLIEPVQSRQPDLQPKEFLKLLRNITKACGIVMIFDEIITGFRILPGGAQKWFDIEADMVTYGKVIGGGIPIGIIAGKAEFMDGIDGGYWSYGDNSYPGNTEKKTAFAGTFCQHPHAMIAVIAVAKYLLNHGKNLQLNLNKRTSDMAKSLNEFFKARKIPVEVVHFGSLFRFKSNMDLDLFFYNLVHKGIYIWEGRNCFLSTAHSVEDINKIVEVVKEVTDTLLKDGFWNVDEIDVENEQYYPLSYAQENIFTLENLKDVGLSYHMPSMKRINGNFDINKVKNIFQVLINRHEAFRTSFHMIEGEPVQKINEEVEFNIEYFDTRNEEYKKIENNFYRPFDLSKAPLIRVGIIQVDINDQILMIDMHHIISDGQSTNILIKEFHQLYNGIELPPIKIQFKDFILSQRKIIDSAKSIGSKEFWINQFNDSIPALDFPLDYSRKDEQSFKSKYLLFKFEEDLTNKLQMLAKKNSVTLFTMLFGIYNVLLSKYTGKEDIVVGTPVLGRESTSVMNTIGMFVNTLPIRNYPSKNLTYEQFVHNVGEQVQDSYANQDYPLVYLLRELKLDNMKDKNPLFDTMFIMDNQAVFKASFNSLEIENLKKVEMGSKVDIQLEALFNGKELEFTLIYCRDLFNEATIDKFAKRFNRMACEIVDNPTKIIGEIESRTMEKSSILQIFNKDIV
ncbi:aminotransferase class III-fold pyridoxal phosphate-dependent enzyme [Clostridium tagluense]|uniref:aminotransferase class III-fold pyridoxal phosphate-dependent enzyme n=1 Tax=Clostridium tagluense TaxID=360422 RepID=UPI001CF5D0E3|nr:aminotransferase class III-fold pyridoxal phosphate-dependent enzyme [Clostridium tagluense]MCB2298650.1 aminotransferase class III-fold pyridoxal phosphate-dependent enzyme [Clostridium tagluense]